jgi:tetratricopeptide (TPR) repeat protein
MVNEPSAMKRLRDSYSLFNLLLKPKFWILFVALVTIALGFKWPILLGFLIIAIIAYIFLWKYHFENGKLQIARGKSDRAIKYFTKLLPWSFNASVVYFQRGIAFHQEGKKSRAIADFTKVISRQPKFISAYQERARVYQNQGQYDLADADYQQALELSPKDSQIYYNRGMLNLDRGEYRAAIEDYETARKLDRTIPSVYYFMAVAAYYDEDLELAKAAFERSIAKGSYSAGAYYFCSDIYAKSGKEDRAQLYYGLAKKAALSREKHGYYAAGMATARFGERKGSIDYFKRALKLTDADLQPEHYRRVTDRLAEATHRLD